MVNKEKGHEFVDKTYICERVGYNGRWKFEKCRLHCKTWMFMPCVVVLQRIGYQVCVTTNKCWYDWSGLIKVCIWSGVRGRQNWKPEGVYPAEHRVCLGGSHCVTHFRWLHESITIKICLLLTGPRLLHRLNFVTDNKWCPVAMPRFVSWYQLVMSRHVTCYDASLWCLVMSRHVLWCQFVTSRDVISESRFRRAALLLFEICLYACLYKVCIADTFIPTLKNTITLSTQSCSLTALTGR